jgi:signal transduction histidine kinase
MLDGAFQVGLTDADLTRLAEIGPKAAKASRRDVAALLQSNLEEVQHMRTLTDRLLMLANNHDIALGPTPLEPLAIEAVNRTIPLAQAKKISIENKVGQVHVTGNSDSLTDVLVILLENAVKYSPAKSTITLSSSKKAKHAELRVSDTGAGITPDDLPHIFDRFYRADTSRSSQNVAGHGLGLSIAKQIVQAHGGRIAAQNNTAGKGTTFIVTLPTA